MYNIKHAHTQHTKAAESRIKIKNTERERASRREKMCEIDTVRGSSQYSTTPNHIQNLNRRKYILVHSKGKKKEKDTKIKQDRIE